MGWYKLRAIYFKCQFLPIPYAVISWEVITKMMISCFIFAQFTFAFSVVESLSCLTKRPVVRWYIHSLQSIRVKIIHPKSRQKANASKISFVNNIYYSWWMMLSEHGSHLLSYSAQIEDGNAELRELPRRNAILHELNLSHVRTMD